MGNECKQCTQDVQQIAISTQQNIITQSHQYSFGMNCFDNDINFEFSSIDIPTVPQFGLEQQKIKALLSPPQALRAASEDSNMSLQDLEETEQQQIKEDIDCAKQIKKFQSQEDYYNSSQSIKMRYQNGSNLTASSEAQIQQQQQQQRPNQKFRQSVWDGRTVNKELQQQKKDNLNSITKLMIQNEERNLTRKVKPKRKTYTSSQFRDDDDETKLNKKKNFNPKLRKDEFIQQKANYQYQPQCNEFFRYN